MMNWGGWKQTNTMEKRNDIQIKIARQFKSLTAQIECRLTMRLSDGRVGLSF
jgi:hypothetical protein